jgi:hypothetical protein
VIQSEQTSPSDLPLPHVETATMLFRMFCGVLQAACHRGAGSDVLSQLNLQLRGFIGLLLLFPEVTAEFSHYKLVLATRFLPSRYDTQVNRNMV